MNFSIYTYLPLGKSELIFYINSNYSIWIGSNRVYTAGPFRREDEEII